MEQAPELQSPIPLRPMSADVLGCDSQLKEELIDEMPTEINEPANYEPPEPDLPSYENKNVAELEEEVAHLAYDHIRNLDEIGFRIFWLNERYKDKGFKQAGGGAKAFCERIGFDLNHWNYLVAKYRLIIYQSQPDKLDQEQTAKAEKSVLKAKKKKNSKKHWPTLFDSKTKAALKPDPKIETTQLSEQPAKLVDEVTTEPADIAQPQTHAAALPGFDDVTETIKRFLGVLPAARQIEELENLIDWIKRKINTIELTMEKAA